MAKKSISLSNIQIGHIITGAVRNLIELKIHESDNGCKFLLVLECMDPEICIGHDQEPESDDDMFDIAAGHAVLEIFDFFENVMCLRGDDDSAVRAFDTIEINKSNIVEFIERLSELDDYWAEVDKRIEIEEDYKNKTAGKNVVDGNGTVN